MRIFCTYFSVINIDKPGLLWLNDYIIIKIKTVKENLPFHILLQRAGGWCEPVQKELAV